MNDRVFHTFCVGCRRKDGGIPIAVFYYCVASNEEDAVKDAEEYNLLKNGVIGVPIHAEKCTMEDIHARHMFLGDVPNVIIMNSDVARLYSRFLAGVDRSSSRV